mmetsp:Transcript_12402/g.19368  ORF Transcript_12402/g.19368 Transcript_12402/m.19368 type:complete len:111 (+) Transcript_12402:2698-3030(+)
MTKKLTRKVTKQITKQISRMMTKVPAREEPRSQQQTPEDFRSSGRQKTPDEDFEEEDLSCDMLSKQQTPNSGFQQQLFPSSPEKPFNRERRSSRAMMQQEELVNLNDIRL